MLDKWIQGVLGMTMIRKNVHLTQRQIKKLNALSKKTGRPVSELIREVIDRYFERKRSAGSHNG
jgi:predicted DNA-binding protein